MRPKTKLLFLLFALAPALLLLATGAGAMESADCLGCHGDRSTVSDKLFIDPAAFAGTPHADVGCVSCHSSVTDSHPDDGKPVSKARCKECHDNVYTEYAKSAHSGNAECGDCHNPHAVRSPTQVSGYDMNRQCASCHDDKQMNTMHAQWLPQVTLHMEALPCITCHTGSKNYVINLFIAKPVGGGAGAGYALASYEDLKKITGEQSVQSLIDTNGDNHISLDELYAFNRNPDYKALGLQGMMMPETVTHSFQVLENRWDCSFCHASGPKAMQTSFLAFPQPDKTYKRMAVERGAVLDALYGTPNFYMLGATRSKVLNIIGLLIIAGGLVLPVGHGTLRFLTRKNRKGHES